MTPLVIIPARLASKRLPGKPLADIAGRPMVAHVVARARAAAIGPVIVATDSPAIFETAETAGARAVMTRADHVSGSDRVAEALALADPQGRHDIVVNLQGDEPEIEPAALRAVLRALTDPGTAIATLATALAPPDAENPHAVKVSGRFCGHDLIEAEAFFRTPPRPGAPALRHVGLYAYRRDALVRFVGLPPSVRERREGLEQLRALEAGMRIVAALVETASHGIDTPADLAAVRVRFAEGAYR